MARGPLAGASGPGPFSARTDGLSMGSIAYGEGVETQAIKQGAAMAKTPDVRGMPASQVREAAMQAPLTPLFAPSQRPDEPITAGAPIGPGPGSEVLGSSAMKQRDMDIVNNYIPVLNIMAANPDTPESFRVFVRYLQGNV